MNAVPGKAWLTVLVAVALVACGCAAPTTRLSEEDRGRVKATRINSAVQKPPQVFLLAPGSSVGLMFGAIGGLAVAGAIQDDRKAFSAFLEKNSISIERIVREEIERALRDSGKLAIAGEGDSSVPAINIVIRNYGYGVTTLLSSSVVPVLDVKCDMVDSSGKLLWSAGDRMGPSIANPIEPTTWEELRDNPQLVEKKWREAAQLIAKKIVSELG